MSKSEAWENNSDTPDITIEINDSTTTMDDDSSVTEPDEEQTKANMTIDEFLDETETIGAELAAEEDPEMDMEAKPALYAGMETTEDNPDEELHRVI